MCKRYAHVRPQGLLVSPHSKRAITIAYETSEKHGREIITAGVSFCSKKDNFSRKIGRQLAEQRLEDRGSRFNVAVYSDNKHEDVVTQVLSSLLAHGNYPNGVATLIQEGIVDTFLSRGEA